MKLLKHYNEGCPVVVAALSTSVPEQEQQDPAQSGVPNPFSAIASQERTDEIVISNAKEDVVIIDVTTGTVQIREGYQPNEAAVLFWEAVKGYLNTEIRKPTLPHTIPLVACPPELKYLAPGHTVGLRIVGRYTLAGVEIEAAELI